MDIRSSKVKSNAGKEPHYRELLGAIALMSVRNITFRQAEDLIAHYAPARYLTKLYGGCRSEHVVDKSTTVSRLTSDNEPFGLAYVNYWPGEYGMFLGYELIKTITIPAGKTYSQLDPQMQSDKKSCTLKKEKKPKKFIPILAKKGEAYGTINKVTKFMAKTDVKNQNSKVSEIKKDDFVFLLSYLGEGYCLVQSGPQIFDLFCPSDDEQNFVQVDSKDQPIKKSTDTKETSSMSSEYVLTKCNEGHWTWIPVLSVMADDNIHFKRADEVGGFN